MNERLPIEDYIPDIQNALSKEGKAVVVAEPGAGKTTIVPLKLLNEPSLAGKSIVILEPRRLAARMAAARMADLLGEPVGQTVGYQIRNDRQISAHTRIHVLTEGILTRRIQDDPMLEDIGLVIFDEFHERNLASDLGMALCLDVAQALRPDLQVIVMSATLNSDAVSKLMGNAPVIHCPGRVFPVETRYLKRKSADSTRAALMRTCTATILEALSCEDGDVLVFLPGAGEIKGVQTRLQKQGLDSHVSVFPLYGNLGKQEQDIAIRPSAPGKRKIVLATSIAETSLTIEGVRIVVDSGLMRTPRYFSGTGMSRLETLPVSKAAADQRQGRAGRLGPGICYRLWTEQDHVQHPDFSFPEILQTDLTPFVLELALWGVREPTDLKWLDLPPSGSMDQARGILVQIGAIDDEGTITFHGKKLARLGIHPRLGHMVLWASERNLGYSACLLASLLSEGDIFLDKGPDRNADIRSRLAVLGKKTCPCSSVTNRAKVSIIQAQAASLARKHDIRQDNVFPDEAGPLLAQAYPERIALGGTGRKYGSFKLASGMAGFLPDIDSLAGEPLIVCADMDGNRSRSRIYLASPYDLNRFELDFKTKIECKDHMFWDGNMVVCTHRQTYGRLILSEQPCSDATEQDILAILIAGIKGKGLDLLPWTRELKSLQARAVFLKRTNPEGDFPDLGEEALLAQMEAWLGPFLTGIRTSAQLKTIDLSAALLALFTWDQRQYLDSQAPTHLTVPSGSRIPLTYPLMDQQSSGVPVLAVRLQEIFGLKETPRIAGGRVPVLIHLLSPAGRPVQVTQDLENFWKNTYDQVKKDLKGRYPKHYWPDDPFTASATRKTKKTMDKQ